MKGGKTPLGYTIVEVMIVLAISGAMFLIASSFISTKQERTAFTQGVNALTTDIQDTIQEVTDGKFSDIPIGCNFTLGSPNVLTLNVPANSQGGNPKCIFAGKFIHFSVAGTGGPAAQRYEPFSLAGGRSATTYTDAKITPVTTALLGGVSLYELTSAGIVPQSLDVKQVRINGSATDNFGIGFVTSLGTISGGKYISGSQRVQLAATSAAITGGGSSMNRQAAAEKVKAGIVLVNSVDICVYDGTKHAHITIGDNNNQLAATVSRIKLGVCT